MAMVMMRFIIALALFSATVFPSAAQEFTLLGGIAQDTGFFNQTGVWQLEYNEGLGEHFTGSISYLNEGHLPGHHRDGYSAQLWTRTTLLDRRLSLAAGIVSRRIGTSEPGTPVVSLGGLLNDQSVQL